MPVRLLHTPRLVALAAAVAGAALGACTSTGPATAAREPGVVHLENFPSGNETADQATLDSLKAVARALAKRDGCTDGTCAVVALGVKPCGGPWEYVAYCPTSTDVPRLEAVAAEVERAERLFNSRYGLASDCSVAALPACAAKSPR